MFTLKTSTDRLMARVAIVLLSLGALYGAYSFGRPVYWRFYATVIHPFEDSAFTDLSLEDDPFSAAVLDQARLQKQAANISKALKTPALGGRKAIEPAVQAKVEAPVKQPEVTAPVVVKVPEKVVKQPFSVDNYPLTKERVHGLLQGGYITVTWANHHYLDFAKSWVYQIRKAGITGYIVGAMDDEMLKDLADLDINTWRMNSGITKNDLGWGSPNFHKMGRVKIALIKQFLELDVTLVISDIDTAWLQNPLPYFDRFPAADILTSTDELRESIPDDGLEIYPRAASAFNIGIMMFRPKSMAFVDDWIKALEDPKMWDQSAFNDIVRVGATHSKAEDLNLFKGDRGKLTIGILPASIFSSGHMFFVQRKYEELGLKPYVAHATFQYSGTPGKRNRFREFLLWDDPPEYFDHLKGFIYMNIEIPKDLLDKAKGVKGPQTTKLYENHFALVHYQLLRLRTVLALATLTGRVVVMPPIWCEIDKYWAPLHDGNIPGSKFKKPFICPMDHVLDIEGGWHDRHSVMEFGPHIEFREYSFMQNPRLTAAVNNSRLVIEPCSGACPGGVTATDVQDNNRLLVSTAADVARMKAVLTTPRAMRYKVLELQAPALEALHQLWATFQGEEKERFERRLKHYTSVGCCLQEQPGWLWYDFFADVPHTDRFGRPFEGNGKWIWYKGDSKDIAQM